MHLHLHDIYNFCASQVLKETLSSLHSAQARCLCAGAALLWRFPHVSAEAKLGPADAQLCFEDGGSLYWLPWGVSSVDIGFSHAGPAGKGRFWAVARVH